MKHNTTRWSLSPFEAARTMSTHDPQPKTADDWAAEVAAVAGRGDRDSFMRIYDHFFPRVRLYLRGQGSAEAVAEELAQEVLLRLWQRAGMFEASRGSLATWLFRIARNLHIDRLRQERYWVALPEGAELPEEATDEAFSRAESYADHVDLARRIEKLPAIQARLIRMSYFEAKTHCEIAAELGMPLGTVKSSLRRAFLKLQVEVFKGVA